MPLGLRPPKYVAARRVLFLAVNLLWVVFGALLWLGPAHQLRPALGERLPWFAIGMAYLVVELVVIEVFVGGRSISMRLIEIPMVVGLILAAPAQVLLGCVVGTVAGRWLVRGPRPEFDIANIAADITYLGGTAWTMEVIGITPGDPLTLHSTAAIFAAIVVANAILGPLVFNTQAWAQFGSVTTSSALRELTTALVSGVTTTSMALIGLTVFLFRPWLLLMLVPIVMLGAGAQVAITQSMKRARRMEFLYTTSDLLQKASDIEASAESLLEALQEMFEVDNAELYVLPSGSDNTTAHFHLSAVAGETATETRTLTETELELMSAVAQSTATIRFEVQRAVAVKRFMKERGILAGMCAPLVAEQGLIGMIILYGSRSFRHRGDDVDARLLSTCAGQLSTALERGQLADAMQSLSVERDQLSTQAFHDSLTQLPNRALFRNRLADALLVSKRLRQSVAVLFIDLDGFKPVNDRYGHGAGDLLLCAVADRLRAAIRESDSAARFGGDEFAVLLENVPNVKLVSHVADRIVTSLAQPFDIAGAQIDIGGSVGIAIATPDDEDLDLETLMERADAAMYEAKHAGKGRISYGQSPPARLSGSI